MAKATTYDFNLTLNEIITEALEKVGAVGEGQTPSGAKYITALRSLNIIVKELQTKKTFLWSVDWRVYPLSASSAVLGTDSYNYRCCKNHVASVLTNKPITGTNYTTFWIRDDSVSGAVWSAVANYTAVNNVTLDTDVIGVQEIFLRTATTDIALTYMSRAEYFAQPDKVTALGQPLKFWFNPSDTAPELFLYPVPTTTTDVLNCAIVRKLKDFDTTIDNPDVRVSWIGLLVAKLVEALSDKYGLPLPERNRYSVIARDLFAQLIADENETGDLRIGIRRR